MTLLSYCKSTEPSCIDLYIAPHATINLKPGFTQNGTYKFEIRSETGFENCYFNISNMGPAMPMGKVVQGPSTRIDSNCKLVSARGITNKGHVNSLKTTGTPATMKINIYKKRASIASSSFSFNYKETELKGRGCPKTKHATADLNLTF